MQRNGIFKNKKTIATNECRTGDIYSIKIRLLVRWRRRRKTIDTKMDRMVSRRFPKWISWMNFVWMIMQIDYSYPRLTSCSLQSYYSLRKMTFVVGRESEEEQLDFSLVQQSLSANRFGDRHVFHQWMSISFQYDDDWYWQWHHRYPNL